MVYIILGTGFEDVEAVAPCDILRRGGVQVQFAGIGGLEVKGSNGVTVKADVTVEDMDLENLEMIVLPGGMGGVHSILGCETALHAVRYAWENGRYVAAICAAPTILAKLGITDGKKAVCYPGLEGSMGSADMQDANAVRDGRLVTGRAPGAALDFGLKLLETLQDAETAARVRSDLVYRP